MFSGGREAQSGPLPLESSDQHGLVDRICRKSLNQKVGWPFLAGQESASSGPNSVVEFPPNLLTVPGLALAGEVRPTPSHTFEFLGACRRIVVCDNLRSGVTRAHPTSRTSTPPIRRWPLGTAWRSSLPGRGRPRDKAKAEVGCLMADRWIIARLRHRTFSSLGELNLVIRELVD